MDENTVMPSSEDLMSAAASDLGSKIENNKPKSSEDNIFDAKKWFLQSYPSENRNGDGNRAPEPKKDDSENKKPKRIIAAVIVVAVALFSIIYLPYYVETHYFEALDDYVGQKNTLGMSTMALYNSIDEKTNEYTTRDVINRYGAPNRSYISVLNGGCMFYYTDYYDGEVAVYFDYSGQVIGCDINNYQEIY